MGIPHEAACQITHPCGAIITLFLLQPFPRGVQYAHSEGLTDVTAKLDEKLEPIFQDVLHRNPGESEFHQAVHEVL